VDQQSIYPLSTIGNIFSVAEKQDRDLLEEEEDPV